MGVMLIAMFHFLCCWNVAADCFKDEIITFLRAKDRIKYAYDVPFNHMRYNVKTTRQTTIKTIQLKDGYVTLLDISPIPTKIK